MSGETKDVARMSVQSYKCVSVLILKYIFYTSRTNWKLRDEGEDSPSGSSKMQERQCKLRQWFRDRRANVCDAAPNEHL